MRTTTVSLQAVEPLQLSVTEKVPLLFTETRFGILPKAMIGVAVRDDIDVVKPAGILVAVADDDLVGAVAVEVADREIVGRDADVVQRHEPAGQLEVDGPLGSRQADDVRAPVTIDVTERDVIRGPTRRQGARRELPPAEVALDRQRLTGDHEIVMTVAVDVAAREVDRLHEPLDRSRERGVGEPRRARRTAGRPR
jgi:hypothetical protein